MIPLVDTHCHLLPGMDDGPRTWDDALTMCRIAWEDGVRGIAATVHQNEHWREVTREKILHQAAELSQRLLDLQIPLSVYPAAEVMVEPDICEAWQAGSLLTMADRGEYLLIELPHGVFLDLRDLISEFVGYGVRPILAHPERQAEYLHDDQEIDELVRRGCLVQVSASSLTQTAQPEITRGLKRWAGRRVIHLIGSDGHSPHKRPPGVRAAYEQLADWEGSAYADRVCSSNGMAVLEGLPLPLPRLATQKRRWWQFAAK